MILYTSNWKHSVNIPNNVYVFVHIHWVVIYYLKLILIFVFIKMNLFSAAGAVHELEPLVNNLDEKRSNEK